MRSTIVFFACALLAGAAARAQDAAHQQESRSKETVAKVIELPARLPGLVAFPKCDDCQTRQLSVDARTKFLIGDEEVSLDRMRLEIRSRPNAMAMVAITPDWRSIEMVFIAARKPGE